MLACVYDTETVGLPSRYDAPLDAVDVWPHMVQFGWALVDLEGQRILSQACELLALPPGVRMEPAAEAIHGFSEVYSRQMGMPVGEVLGRFSEAAAEAGVLVCHNVGFDRGVVFSEAVRYGRGDVCERLRTEHFCTKLGGVDLCRLPGKYGFKWPRLVELHSELLGWDFHGAHDALADVTATARCLLRMWEIGGGTLPVSGKVI